MPTEPATVQFSAEWRFVLVDSAVATITASKLKTKTAGLCSDNERQPIGFIVNFEFIVL
jgi:hypothetical protein